MKRNLFFESLNEKREALKFLDNYICSTFGVSSAKALEGYTSEHPSLTERAQVLANIYLCVTETPVD